MKLRTRLFWWYGSALLAALVVLLVHAGYEVYEHRNDKEGGEDTEVVEIIMVELVVGVPLLVLGLTLTWWMTRGTLDKLQQLTDAAAGLHAGNLEVNLPASQPVRDELDRLVEVFRDMTTRLRGSFAQTRDFTLNASHELKTPLTIMRGEVETALRQHGGAPDQAAWMESLLEEIDRLARVVDALSFLAKVDAGQVELRTGPVDFSELVSDAAEDAQLLAGPHGLTVHRDLPSQPCAVNGDKHRLRQLLLNLVDNAVKYNQPGGHVSISLKLLPDLAVLEVSNPGPGIPPEWKDRIFERFFRGDASHDQRIEGSGLGLNISQWIARRHGGDISVETGSDGLTRATVRLPRSG